MIQSVESRASASARVAAVAAALLLLTGLSSCGDAELEAHSWTPAADELREPTVFTSSHGVLDLLVVAEASALPELKPYQATGWVYEICPRPAGDARSCPEGAAQSDYYAGSRLQLSPGDVLKIRLVNRLPRHSPRPGQADADAFLALNPTNIHTHGLLVSPRYATPDDPTWGDNVFVYDFNSANGVPNAGSDLHGTPLLDVVDYSITIPRGHPSGLYWFHPHVHGISARQVSAGLSGIITVGSAADYACSGGPCNFWGTNTVPTRHLILKDMQVLKDGTPLLDQDSGFCGSNPTGAPARGGCAGGTPAYATPFDYRGGRWFFTINGQQYPTITVNSSAGQLWRIVNASANATYHLSLWNPGSKSAMLMRVVSIDGVGIDVGAATDPAGLISQAGNRFQPVPCPDTKGVPEAGVCTTMLDMMPSSRAEVWVTYRNENGAPQTAPPGGARAVFRTNGYRSGPDGDEWPAVDLAQVAFAQSPGQAEGLTVEGQPPRSAVARDVAADLRRPNAAVPSDPTCTPLAPGHLRRIFFGTTSQPPQYLGLGYEEIDAQGLPVAGTFLDVAPFDPTTPTVCVPLGAGNAPATERWQLVNLMGMDHNFHIHQAHFSVVDESELAGTAVPGTLHQQSVLMDSLPLLHADGACASVADWRAGTCTAHPATVEITFTAAGDFVYHCHILAHEDAGMMAVIRVRPDPSTESSSLVDQLFSSMRLPNEQITQPLTPRMFGAMCRGGRFARGLSALTGLSESASQRPRGQ